MKQSQAQTEQTSRVKVAPVKKVSVKPSIQLKMDFSNFAKNWKTTIYYVFSNLSFYCIGVRGFLFVLLLIAILTVFVAFLLVHFSVSVPASRYLLISEPFLKSTELRTNRINHSVLVILDFLGIT